MNKDLVIKVLGILLIIAGHNWFVDSTKLNEA